MTSATSVKTGSDSDVELPGRLPTTIARPCAIRRAFNRSASAANAAIHSDAVPWKFPFTIAKPQEGHTHEIVYITRLQLRERYKFLFVPKTTEQGA